MDSIADITKSLPSTLDGTVVEYTLSDCVDEWDDIASPADIGPLKFLESATPSLEGMLQKVFNETIEHFRTIALEADKTKTAATANQNVVSGPHPEEKELILSADSISAKPTNV